MINKNSIPPGAIDVVKSFSKSYGIDTLDFFKCMRVIEKIVAIAAAGEAAEKIIRQEKKWIVSANMRRNKMSSVRFNKPSAGKVILFLAVWKYFV